MIINPTFVASLETNMHTLFSAKYTDLTKDMWWNACTYEVISKTLREIVYFKLETAKLHRGLGGGFKTFDDMRYLNSLVENEYHQSAFELTEAELSDLDANGAMAAANWIQEIAELCSHHPQQQVANAILNTALLAYDGLSYFNTGHFTNGVDNTNGVYSNVFTGTSGTNGLFAAAPIGGATTLDQAAVNLTRVIAYIKSLKTPTNYPRKLRVKAIIVPPALYGRAVQLVNAAYLPGAAVSGGGTADNRPLATSWSIGQPLCADELGAVFTGGADDIYYVATEFVGEEAAFIYSNRQPFAVRYNSGMTDADLERADKLQWTCKGRNGLLPLHPYGLFQVKAT